MIQSIHLCCCYLNPSALIWPYIFWQMLSYLRDRNALPFCGQTCAPSPPAYVTIPCPVCIQVLWLPWDTTPLYFGPRSPQHAELYGDCLHAWGTWEHVKLWHSVRMPPAFVLNCWSSAICPQLSFWLLICCPSSHFELFIFCNVRMPQLSFWIVNPLPCANTPSFHFELFIVCNVRMPSAFISFTMYTDYREGILARITGYTILILATATSTHRQF